MTPKPEIVSIDMRIVCDIGRRIVTVTLPGKPPRTLRYAVHIEGDRIWPAFMPSVSSPLRVLMGVNPEAPQMLETIANHWHATLAGAGRQVIAMDIRHRTARDGEGRVIPHPDLTSEESVVITALITLDTDHDGIVAVTMEQLDARVRLIGKRLMGEGQA